MHFPTNNDTANKGRLLTEGSDASSGTTDLTVGTFQLDAYNYTSDLIKVSKQLLQDTGVNFASFLQEQLAERLGRIYNEALTIGTGSSQPQGFQNAATIGKTTASGTAITQAEITDLKYSVDRAYRNENSAFMMHDSTVKEIIKLDTSTSNYSQPLWQPSFREGEPSTILGFRYFVNNDMDEIAADKRVIAFGDWSKFYIRIVNGLENYKTG